MSSLLIVSLSTVLRLSDARAHARRAGTHSIKI